MPCNTGFGDVGSRQPKRFKYQGNDATKDIISALSAAPAHSPGDVTHTIRITSLMVIFGATTTLTFKSNTTEIGRMTPAAATEVVLPYNPDGWMETVAGAKFAIANSAAAQIQVIGTYVEI